MFPNPFLEPLGVGPDAAYFCIEHTNVNYSDVSWKANDLLNEACHLVESVNFRFVSDALYCAAMCNEKFNYGEMVSSLYDGDNHKQISFSQALLIIINQQEHVVKFNNEMLPQFIRQFEDANIIRKARNAEKIQISDVMLAILYSDSLVAELLKRYGIDSEKILKSCQV